jgi:exopolysaccharide biosynthesis polyprenyl glycosylphosphotransferase
MTVTLVILLSVFLVVNGPHTPHGLEEFLLVRITPENLLALGGFAVLWPIIFASFGLYNPAKLRTPADEAMRIGGACSLIAASTVLLLVSSASGAFQARVVIFFWLCSIGGTLTVRHLIRWVLSTSHRSEPRQVLIIGSGPRALHLYRNLVAETHVACHVIGFVDSNNRIMQREIRRHILGRIEDLEDLLMRRVVDEVLIALPIKSCYQQIQDTINICERVGVEARYLADIFQSSIARPEYEHSARGPVVALKVRQDDLRILVKRLFDIVAAAVGLVMLAPLFVVIAAAIKLTSPGPVFFAQERYGFNKRRFRMYKFRTMVIDAEELMPSLEHLNEAVGPIFKIARDPRITRVGGFLRRTSLDELPQLVNVLRGEMSLVGPRPMSVRDVTRFPEAWLMRRFSVLPGLTCLWQISGRSNLSFNDWIKLDLQYIDTWTLVSDLKILFKTIPVVFNGRGAV